VAVVVVGVVVVAAMMVTQPASLQLQFHHSFKAEQAKEENSFAIA